MARSAREALHRIHHIDHDRELGLEPLAHRPRPRLEAVDRLRDRACVDEQAATLVREPRITRRAIEELHAELRFEVRECLAHDGLRAAELAARGGEAAFVHGRDERAELVERHVVEHAYRPSRWLISKYIGFTDGTRD